MHLGWVARHLTSADGYITAGSYVCLQLFGGLSLAAALDCHSDAYPCQTQLPIPILIRFDAPLPANTQRAWCHPAAAMTYRPPCRSALSQPCSVATLRDAVVGRADGAVALRLNSKRLCPALRALSPKHASMQPLLACSSVWSSWTVSISKRSSATPCGVAPRAGHNPRLECCGRGDPQSVRHPAPTGWRRLSSRLARAWRRSLCATESAKKIGREHDQAVEA